jgi:hypothetical protein
MKKIIEEDWKPSYFYIRYVTVGQLLPLIKEGLIGFFSFLILFGIIGYFTVDDWNVSVYEQGKVNWSKNFLGIDNIVWYLIIFAIISWLIKGKERTFKIPRFDKVEWVMINLSMIIFVIIFNLLSWYIGMIAFISMMVIGKTYEDMVYIGKENYEGRSSYD